VLCVAPPLCSRLGLPLRYDTGEPSLCAAAIAEASLRPGARRCPVFLDHARSDPELQICGSACGRASFRALEGGGRSELLADAEITTGATAEACAGC
jgi:hypothetical protein